ncbi:MAG: glycine zipper domain-containing protein [Candidatus Brocadiaceae bacterium]|nr:glycine zipper domain-containing protein [Candidatus Brocadiaceae bacterium]
MKTCSALLNIRKKGFGLLAIMTMISLVVFFIAGSHVISAAELFVYPKEGQSVDQTNRDKFECHEWAKQQTGIDPFTLATDTTPKQTTEKGGAFRGAARGATIGVIGGAIGGDAGKGAAIGGAVGALGGTMRKRQSEKEQQQTYEQANRQKQAMLDTYERAYRACLEGRGYTVQ